MHGNGDALAELQCLPYPTDEYEACPEVQRAYTSQPFDAPAGCEVQAPEPRELQMLPSVVHEPSVSPQYRKAMQSRFCELFFPPARSKTYQIIFEPEENDSQTLAMTAAGDALCTIQLAIAHSDRGLLQDFRRMYTLAIRRIQFEVEQADLSKPLLDLITAVYFLNICERIVGTRLDDSHWMMHTSGLITLFNAREGETLQPGSSLWLFVQFSYHGVLAYGLLTRHNVVFCPPAWANEAGVLQFPLTCMALQVPGYLERLDRFATGNVSNRVADVVAQALQLRRDMHQSMLAWSIRQAQVPYYTVDIAEFFDFTSMMGEDLSELYQSAYRYSDMPAFLLHRTLWQCLLLLDQAILDVRGLHWERLQGLDANELDALENEMAACADNLAQSLPFLVSGLDNTTGGYCGLLEPVYFLEQYFRRHGTSRHLAWCLRVKHRMSLGVKVAQMLAVGGARSKDGFLEQYSGQSILQPP